MVKMDLLDVSVDEKDWKQFKKTAAQEELLILGVGVKYRLVTKRIISYLAALGIILSVAIGLVLISALDDISAGLIVLVVGYVICSFLATKFIRYSDSYGKIKRKLDPENKKVLKELLKVSAAAAVFDEIVKLIIMYTTIPYQAILMFIGLFAPNFVISKNGVLLAIPRSCGLDNFETIGAYYASFSLFDEWEEGRRKYKATFINDKGCEQTVYSPDKKEYYSSDWKHVGSSDDGGKTIKPDN